MNVFRKWPYKVAARRKRKASLECLARRKDAVLLRSKKLRSCCRGSCGPGREVLSGMSDPIPGDRTNVGAMPEVRSHTSDRCRPNMPLVLSQRRWRAKHRRGWGGGRGPTWGKWDVLNFSWADESKQRERLKIVIKAWKAELIVTVSNLQTQFQWFCLSFWLLVSIQGKIPTEVNSQKDKFQEVNVSRPSGIWQLGSSLPGHWQVFQLPPSQLPPPQHPTFPLPSSYFPLFLLNPHLCPKFEAQDSFF